MDKFKVGDKVVITETKETMREVLGYRGKYDKGDIVTVGEVSYPSFKTVDEMETPCTWIDLVHAETAPLPELDPEQVPFGSLSSEQKKEIMFAFIDGKPVEYFNEGKGEWINLVSDRFANKMLMTLPEDIFVRLAPDRKEILRLKIQEIRQKIDG